jgi:hypothetical protein
MVTAASINTFRFAAKYSLKFISKFLWLKNCASSVLPFWRVGLASFVRVDAKREKPTGLRRLRIDHSIRHCWR